MLSRSTGDEKAQLRANELVLQAIEKGGPEVQERFLQEVSQHLPEGTVKAPGKLLKPGRLRKATTWRNQLMRC